MIRNAIADDYPAIIAMMHALAAEEQGICRLTESELERQVAAGTPALTVYVAEPHGIPCGCILAYPGYDVLSASSGWHLSDFFVQREYRGKGIGTALLARLADDGLRNGREWISWTVLASNHAAASFYKRRGASGVDVRFMAMGMTAMHRLVACNRPLSRTKPQIT